MLENMPISPILPHESKGRYTVFDRNHAYKNPMGRNRLKLNNFLRPIVTFSNSYLKINNAYCLEAVKFCILIILK